MESSNHSSSSKGISSKEEKSCSEESGWTMYFDEFLTAGYGESSSCYSDYRGSSMVSDAASCAAWNKPLNHVIGQEKSCRKLSFKKRSRALDEDPLEDTASSPVNSPKISSMRKSDMNTREKDWNRESNQEKEIRAARYTELQTDERNELGFLNTGNNCIELKQRGLCLVPLSMLVKYIG